MPLKERIGKCRANVVIAVAVFLVALIAARLIELCIFKFDDYQKKVIDQVAAEIILQEFLG